MVPNKSYIYLTMMILFGSAMYTLPIHVPLTCTKGERQRLHQDKTCNTDCSQKPPRIPGDNVFFNCSIEELQDSYQTRDQLKKYETSEELLFEAPTLNSVNLVQEKFHSSYAIRIKFSLPKGRYNPTWILPQAVWLTFQSIEDSHVQDQYYFRCPRQILFKFWNYKPLTAYDIEHPRTIPFDCFDLINDVSRETLVYNLTLHTAHGHSAIYVLTVPMRQGNNRLWKPVIATYLDKTTRSVHVLIEKSSRRTTGCEVHLMNQVDGTRRTQRLKTACETTIFQNVTYGSYVVEVIYKGECDVNNVCLNMSSYIIHALDLPKHMSAKQNYVETPWKLYVAIFSFGCFLVTLGVAVCMFSRRRKAFSHSANIQAQDVQAFLSTTDNFNHFIPVPEETRPDEIDCIQDIYTGNDTLNSLELERQASLNRRFRNSREGVLDVHGHSQTDFNDNHPNTSNTETVDNKLLDTRVTTRGMFNDTRNAENNEYIPTPGVLRMFKEIEQINISAENLNSI